MKKGISKTFKLGMIFIASANFAACGAAYASPVTEYPTAEPTAILSPSDVLESEKQSVFPGDTQEEYADLVEDRTEEESEDQNESGDEEKDEEEDAE